ncbi:endo-beta-N-acetylglucosaminidase [Streptomyces nodosus]|uniref:Endo-beta-N-acetylglucosaminidase n=1 Tax=Streptomyces nodosus TaxID=40318 RepID=A0A0B5DG57_9ACTN|nr:endo-beta-N-acetylglucosaminidase [Streptomyces nodosus]AJE39451.1 endo-beta-N-acetylglucosaminidase [Streptomyces nodosus]MBB4790384.1 endo-beta-N-acetylglucosaminidase D [Streptomyces nodosus]QEV38037.1 endo-beta-N-acetylglucosaminidase [Streptomyces nodosus]
MNLSRRTVLLAGAAAALTPALPLPAASAAARDLQPYASYWYPDSLPSGTPGAGITWRSLKSWRAADDTDLAFNAASVPLAARFTPTPANTTARSGQARVQSLVSFGPTSANPSQGAPTADYYALTHWAYLDELVFWGGSSGEGLILAPNAPIVDAAHRHGVPVLGNIFLPPVAYGGQLQWTRDLVQKDGAGRFPLAAQLVAVAEAYGFDGWFVNAETGGGNSALGADMLGFVKELKALSAAKGLRVTWYDAMTVNGTVSWQGALDSQNQEFFRAADSLFVDFRWSRASLASSGALAEQLGRSRHELWAGVDVESGGTNTSVDWDAIVPTTAAHVTSIGYYRPEWTRNHLPASRTPGDFHTADDLFWTGSSLDPSAPDTTARWRAPAVSVADRSTVDALPFASVFNTGHGLRWYEDGRVGSDTPWNHLGLQDRLPSRRWAVRTDGTRPTVAFDFEDAWRGGSSVLVSGALDAPATLELYATRLPIGPGTVVELTHRADAGDVRIELAVATTEPGTPGQAPSYTYFPVTGGDGWRTATVPLTGLSGTVRRLAVRLTGGGGQVRWRLGGIAVRDTAVTPAAPVRPRITDADGGSLRFAWEAAPAAGPAPRHYELHRILPDGRRRFLGGTCQRAFHVGGLGPEPGESVARFELRAVGELYNVSPPARLTHRW